MSKAQKTIYIILAIVILIGLSGLGFGLRQSSNRSGQLPEFGLQSPKAQLKTSARPTKSLDGKKIVYQGVEGENALEILKQGLDVKTKSFEGLGEFVQSIDGIEGDNKMAWIFYLNGQPANQGAGSYITKNDDTIEWKYEEIKDQ